MYICIVNTTFFKKKIEYLKRATVPSNNSRCSLQLFIECGYNFAPNNKKECINISFKLDTTIYTVKLSLKSFVVVALSNDFS